MKVNNKFGGFMISEIIPEIIDEIKHSPQSRLDPNRGIKHDVLPSSPDPKRVKTELEDDFDDDYEEDDDEIEKGQVIKSEHQTINDDQEHELSETDDNKVFYECMSSASDSLHSSPRASSSPKSNALETPKTNTQNPIKNLNYYSYMQQLLSAFHHQNIFSQNSLMGQTMSVSSFGCNSSWNFQDNLLNPNHDSSLVSSSVTNNSSSPASSTSSVSSLSVSKTKLSKKLDEETNLDPNTTGMARYQCDACSKSYSTFGGLSKHKQFHCSAQIQKQFTCKYCDKMYNSLGALKMHIRTHTLPCKCKICGKCFSRPWLLQGHVRTHTGEKPFKCEVCARAFADRSNLRAHMQTHSDVKKYKCEKCAKTFSRMSLLNKHALNCANNNCISSSSSSISNKTSNRVKHDLIVMPQQFYNPQSNSNNLATAVAQYNKYLAVLGHQVGQSNNLSLNEQSSGFKSTNIYKSYELNQK